MFALKVLPKAGEGPSKETRENGYFHTSTLGVGREERTSKSPPMVVARISSGNAGDPGYKATAQMAIEAALTLALNREKCLAGAAGGVLTPASGMGMALVERLINSGMELSVHTVEESQVPIPLDTLQAPKMQH